MAFDSTNVTKLPEAPISGDANFDEKADVFLPALVVFSDELDQYRDDLITYVEGKTTGLDTKVAAADASATAAANSASTAATKATEAATSASSSATKATESANSAAAALASKNAAATSATSASTSAGSASTSAGTASTKASKASASATLADTKAAEAASSAGTASSAADTATTKAAEATTSASTAATHASTAGTKATEAANSASSASTSATNSATSANTASTHASNAASSATAAAGSATIASTKAGEASTSATSALSSANTATSKASLASGYKDAAATSATSAASSASTASTAATTATTKASEASTSATTASTAATTATTKAGEASTSAIAAAASEAKALEYKNSIVPGVTVELPRPIFHWDCANAPILHPKATFSRGSQGSYFDGNGILRYADNNVPRFDHDPLTGICKGLLVEPAVTFLDTYSEQFDNAAWTKTRATITANAVTAPDGTLTADKLVEDTTATSSHSVDRLLTTTASPYVFSCFAMASGRSKLILAATTDAQGLGFDLVSGSTFSQSYTANNASGGVIHIGGGVFYCWMTWTATATTNSLRIVLHNGTSHSYTGDGTSGLYIWGAKLYAGTGPTSYLPTVASGVTRAADVCSVDLTKLTRNGSPLWNGTEGTVVVDAELPARASGIYSLLEINDNSLNNRLAISYNGAGNCLNIELISGGSVVAGYYPAFTGGRTKIAMPFKSNDVNYAKDGVSGTKDTSCAVQTMNNCLIGSSIGGLYLGGHVRSIQLYNRRIADEHLPALSAL